MISQARTWRRKPASIIHAETKKPVELKNPGIEFFIYIFENRGYFGIDVSGMELDKREYRIMPHPTDVKAAIAFSLMKIAGYTGNQVVAGSVCAFGNEPH